ncbi:GNAT family N-acetyltransferase [Methanobacterium sp.]|uniref:GNAT family N-acetyltransferase n=1 Tax=Methanobacterium sp. TaxID=2164 RepID=UPI003C72AB1A
MSTDREIASLIEYNTAKFFLNLGYLNGDEVCDTPEIKYVFTKNWFNRIFMANFDESDVSTSVELIVSRIKKLNISVSWYVTPQSCPTNLQNLLKHHCFIYKEDWKAMAIELKTVPESFDIPEGMEIKEILNLDELKTWTDVLVESFEFSKIIASYKKYFINAGLNNLDFHYYLGFLNGKPVATGILFKGEGAAGLFYIGTIPKARGQGIAKAMVHYLLREAKNKGYNISILQASEMGYPLYKKIGFKKYYTTKIYRR